MYHLQSCFAGGSRHLRKLTQTLHGDAYAKAGLAAKSWQVIMLEVMMLMSVVYKILSYKQSKNKVTDALYRSICFSPLEKIFPNQTKYEFFGSYRN